MSHKAQKEKCRKGHIFTAVILSKDCAQERRKVMLFLEWIQNTKLEVSLFSFLSPTLIFVIFLLCVCLIAALFVQTKDHARSNQRTVKTASVQTAHMETNQKRMKYSYRGCLSFFPGTIKW